MSRKDTLRVAIAQIDCELGNLETNFQKHLDYIQQARKEGVDVLLFPELSLTGYAIGPQTVDMSLDRNDPHLLELARAAGPMWTLVGFMEEGVAAQFHNSQVALRSGNVAFIHRKLNLATYGRLEEGKHFAEGRYYESFQLDDPRWNAGTLICSDAWNPALVHLAAVHGTTLLLLPIASTNSAVDGDFFNPHGWAVTSEFYAMIYGFPVCMANHASGVSGLDFWGGSRILNPYGTVVAEAGEKEELVAADILYEDVKRARYRLPTIRDSNLDMVLRELQRLSRRIGIPEVSRELPE
ncbi:MAG: hypothetical protein K9L68_03740 [Spirochaetales bacterium]|nr:hypothetical protein [Spirochaetales bacterium]MCF7937691.1 hypothetical protein [Spirochaetales bacterium]